MSTPEEREAFYDREIAPALLELGKRCHEAGLSFLAVAEWAPGESGRTRQFVEPYGLAIEIADAALRAGNNVDALLMFLMKLGKERGHSSALLHQLGVPLQVDKGIPIHPTALAEKGIPGLATREVEGE